MAEQRELLHLGRWSRITENTIKTACFQGEVFLGTMFDMVGEDALSEKYLKRQSRSFLRRQKELVGEEVTGV